MVGVRDGVNVGVKVWVGVKVGVKEGVNVGLAVKVEVMVGVKDGVGLGVKFGSRQTGVESLRLSGSSVWPFSS